MSRRVLRRHVSMPGLLACAREVFAKVPDPVRGRLFSLADCLMSGLAIFTLKFPSLLKYDEQCRGGDANTYIQYNLRTLFGVQLAPSDSCLRERLDVIDPDLLRGAFKALFASVQRSRSLHRFALFDGHCLLSLDGTQYFTSDCVHCKNCCVKTHRGGSKSYYHQVLGAALVHPDHKIVLPLAPQPIRKQDGARKNDCERNASKRFIEKFREDHPRLKTIVVEDGLASNGPHIKMLQSRDLRYILGAKPGDHSFLFEWVSKSKHVETFERKRISKKGVVLHTFKWLNDAPLNDSNFDVRVNFLEYQETHRKTGKTRTFSWVTDLLLDKDNVKEVMRAARARWRIENETFKTLKCAGFGFEHSYGHGKAHLSSVFANLAMLALLIDQVQELCCGMFQQALKWQKRKSYLWEEMRSSFTRYTFESWDVFWLALSDNDLGMFSYESLLEPKPP